MLWVLNRSAYVFMEKYESINIFIKKRLILRYVYMYVEKTKPNNSGNNLTAQCEKGPLSIVMRTANIQISLRIRTVPSGHMTFIQRRLNVDATA